jgi:hypothetical protein
MVHRAVAANATVTRCRARHALPIVVLAVLGVACRREPPAIEKARIATLPPTHQPNRTLLSEDGRAYAFVTKADDGERVVTAKGATDVHAECAKLAFAPKTERLFYWTRDGEKDQPTITLVADGVPVPTDFIAPGEMAFSADGSRWVAAGVARGPENGTFGPITLFVDGAALTRVADMSLPSFSLDGRHLAYLTAAERRASLVVDGEVRQNFEPPTTECGAAALRAAPQSDLGLRHIVRYLADGTLLVVTRDAEGWGVYVDGRRIASYVRATIDPADAECAKGNAIATRSLRVSENAPVAFWWERVAGDAELWRVVRNGRPVDDITCVEPWRRHPPEPSADGQHVIYACPMTGSEQSQVVFLVKDGVRYGPYDNVWGIAPTKNFAHVAYGAARGTEDLPWSIYVDGEARVQHLRAVWRPRVSEDGSTLAWEATVSDDGGGFFGIDDHRLGSFDEVLWGPEPEPGERMVWVVRRGRKITRFSIPIAAARNPNHPRVIRTPSERR